MFFNAFEVGNVFCDKRKNGYWTWAIENKKDI